MQRPSTAPIPSITASDNHARSHSRLAASIKTFLSRSSFSYSETDQPSRPKWRLDISTSPPRMAQHPPTHPLAPQNRRERDPKPRNVLRRRPSGSARSLKRRDLPSSPLTPASALAEAYKQQDLFRDDPPKPSIDSTSPRISHGSGYDRDHSLHSPSPYDPTCRSSPERPLQAPPDRYAAPLARGTSRAMPCHHPSPSDPSLTRKVSTKWRKIKGGVAPEHRDRVPATRAMSRSIDTVSSQGPWSSPIEPHSPRPSGPKLWRLMRRLSTGGLRDQFQTEKAVPPVPAIPKELLHKANQAERSNEPVSTLLHQPSSPRHKDPTTPAPHNVPSAAITSSSSNSSDVASIHFFHKSHSARSSVTSYGEALQDVSLDRHIIAPIEQLRLGDGDPPATPPRSPRRSASVPAPMRMVEDEHVPLPPPRRQTTSGGSPSPACSRPPSTSVSSPASTLASRLSSLVGRHSQTADGLVSLSPPPRPARNSRRAGSTASSPPHSLLVKQVDGIGARHLDRTLSAQSDATARASPEPRASPQTHCTYRELGTSRRPPLSEREKVDIWNDLLDRSDRAGGTLHIAGTAELMSDNLRFSLLSEV